MPSVLNAEAMKSIIDEAVYRAVEDELEKAIVVAQQRVAEVMREQLTGLVLRVQSYYSIDTNRDVVQITVDTRKLDKLPHA